MKVGRDSCWNTSLMCMSRFDRQSFRRRILNLIEPARRALEPPLPWHSPMARTEPTPSSTVLPSSRSLCVPGRHHAGGADRVPLRRGHRRRRPGPGGEQCRRQGDDRVAGVPRGLWVDLVDEAGQSLAGMQVKYAGWPDSLVALRCIDPSGLRQETLYWTRPGSNPLRLALEFGRDADLPEGLVPLGLADRPAG